MMIKRVLLITFIVALLAPMTALADMYFGAAVGNSWFSHDPEIEDVKEISENSTGWKIFGGFQNDSFLGVEGGYRDLGKVTYKDSNVDLNSKTKGWDVEAMGRIKIAIIDVFAKAGAFFWKTEAAVNELSGDESGTAFLWGLGAGVRLGPIGVRLEWESMEVKEPDSLTMVSLGATLGF